MDNALEIEGVCKNYQDFALREVAFRLPRGYIMGLIGPNGSGKTTLIKLILNLIRRDGGSIRVFGLDNLAHEAEIKSHIGFVPDEPRLHEDVTLENLKSATAPLYPDWDEHRFRALASEFGLPLRKKFKAVSHGTRTRFMLAQALCHGAELVLLDEPTTGLDPVFRRTLLDMLAGVLQDERVAILYSTHITSDLERAADFVTFLRNGRVVFSSPKDEVIGSWGVVPKTRSRSGSARCISDMARSATARLAVECTTRRRLGMRHMLWMAPRRRLALARSSHSPSTLHRPSSTRAASSGRIHSRSWRTQPPARRRASCEVGFEPSPSSSASVATASSISGRFSSITCWAV